MGVLVKVCINMYSWYGNTFSGGGLGPVGLTLNYTWHISQIAWLLLEHWSPEGANGSLLLGDCLVRILGGKKTGGLVRDLWIFSYLPKSYFMVDFEKICYNLPGWDTYLIHRGGRISSQGCLSSEPVRSWLISSFFFGNFWETYEAQILWLRCG